MRLIRRRMVLAFSYKFRSIRPFSLFDVAWSGSLFAADFGDIGQFPPLVVWPNPHHFRRYLVWVDRNRAPPTHTHTHPPAILL